MSLGNILVVDDDEGSRWALQEHLRSQGYMVQSAGSAHDAMKALETFWPDLLLTDMMLGDGSGLDLIGRVKDAPGAAAPGCLLVTAYGTLETAMEAIHRGADEYMLKPLALAELETVVAALMLRFRQVDGALAPGTGDAALSAWRQAAKPLALLRAYLEMLAEGRFGSVSSTQEEKILYARGWVRDIGDLLRGVGPLPLVQTPLERVERADLAALIRRLGQAWCQEYGHRGVTVAWAPPPPGAPLLVSLRAFQREVDDLLAENLAQAGLGDTLQLSWSSEDHHLVMAIRLGPGHADLTVRMPHASRD
jgi:DNA-binding response OmpR family regulator